MRASTLPWRVLTTSFGVRSPEFRVGRQSIAATFTPTCYGFDHRSSALAAANVVLFVRRSEPGMGVSAPLQAESLPSPHRQAPADLDLRPPRYRKLQVHR